VSAEDQPQRPQTQEPRQNSPLPPITEQNEEKCLPVSSKLPLPLKYSNPLRLVLGGHSRGPKNNGKPTWEMPIYPYPTRTGWNATNSTFQPVEGKRGGVDKIAERFRPATAK
jgi:hypothetical protein